MPPEPRSTHSSDVNIAYQVVGDAPRDLVLVPGWVSKALVGVPGARHLGALEPDGGRE